MELLTALTFDAWSVLAQSLIFGILLAVAVQLALAILVPVSASTRFAIWFATLIVVALMPAVLFLKTALPLVQAQETPRMSAAASSGPIPFHAPAGPSTTPDVRAKAERAWQPAVLPFTARRPGGDPPRLLIPADDAAGILALSAIVAAGLLFGRLGFSYWRLRRLKARAFPAAPELSHRFETWLSLCNTARPVRLLLSTSVRSPMAVGFERPAIIIPDSLLLQLTGEQIDHLGLHELAHIRRYDDWTNLVQRAIGAVLFFHPAVHWISSKLDFEREVACDDWVLALTGSPKPYARSLTKVLEQSPWRCGALLASGAVFRKRHIIRRIEMLLDKTRDSSPRISALTVVVVLMCLLGAFSQIIQTPALIAFGESHAGTVTRSTWTSDGRSLEAEIRGKVEFGEDDISVDSISPGGFVKVRENGWTGRLLEIRPGDSGQPEARYFVAGKERPFDGPARAWALDILTLVIREHGINAEERALRILDKRGSAGLFAEVDRISSDGSRRRYLSMAMQSGKLSADELRRAIVRAGRISSDHEKASLFVDVASVYALKPELLRAYFEAVNTINSDHDRRRVLTTVVEQSAGDSAVLEQVGRSVERMSSDHEKSAVLQLPAVRMAAAEPAARRALIRATGSINSDTEKANALGAIVRSGPLGPELMEDILRESTRIQSDHEKARVLELTLQNDLDPNRPLGTFFSAVGTIGSDNERTRVLSAAIDRNVAGPITDELARAIEQIGSDNEKANLLVKLASRASTPAFLSAVRSLNSDNERRRVIDAIAARGNSVPAAMSAVSLASSLNSDHEKAEVLLAIADKYSQSAEVRDAIRKTAETISSDSDYRRIISKLPPFSAEAKQSK